MELNVELLLGRKVLDPAGDVVGRIEEIRAERTEDSLLVESYMVGASAVIERLSAWTLVRPIKRMLKSRDIYSVFEVHWKDLDLSNPERPALRIPRSELRHPR